MGENSKKSLIEMYENGNLQNRVMVQVCQKLIRKSQGGRGKRRDGKSKSTDKKQDVNNRFMVVLYRNSDPAVDPPRTEFLWWQNPNLNKVEKVRFGDNRHVITSKRKLVVGVDGRDNRSNDVVPLPLGSHCNLLGGVSGLRILGKQRRG
jgi:hypothetical protein